MPFLVLTMEFKLLSIRVITTLVVLVQKDILTLTCARNSKDTNLVQNALVKQDMSGRKKVKEERG